MARTEICLINDRVYHVQSVNQSVWPWDASILLEGEANLEQL
jgi:hypothetical protein